MIHMTNYLDAQKAAEAHACGPLLHIGTTHAIVCSVK